MTDSQLKAAAITAAFEPLKVAYEEYLENFDPSPQNYGDDYSSPLDFDEWMLEMEEADE